MKIDKQPLRSGEYCKCGHCGYEGYAYGVPHGAGKDHPAGVSAPWCQQCGMNDKLTPIPLKAVHFRSPRVRKSGV